MMKTLLPLMVSLLPLALASCDDEPEPETPATEWPADQVAIVIPADDPAALLWAAEDLRDVIGAMTGDGPELVSAADETDARFLLAVGGGPWPCPEEMGIESYALLEGDHDDRPALFFCGGDLLGRQYAIYSYLHALDVRFVHPEQTFVPQREALPAGLPEGLDQQIHAPGLAVRGFHSHTQHPLELLEALLTDDADEVERSYRYVDWLVRNLQNRIQWILLDSVPQDEMLAQAGRVIDYAHERGVTVSAVSSFNEEQQNAHRMIDPDDAVDDIAELRAGLDALMEVPWDAVVFNSGSSEFSETNDVETVAWMDEAATYLRDQHGGTAAYTSNHVPAGLMSETYGVNFYDLPQFADPAMGTYVHTTMCYGLEGPAPVYGNADFSRQRNFLVDQVDDRAIIYYPESAWWLTFDNAIPLFLPVYLRVRADDIRFIGQVDGVQGHVTFTSGWEWGYWLTDLMIAHHTLDPSRTMSEVLDELLAPIHPDAADIVTRMAESQYEWLIEERLMPFMTAEDLPTEIGYRAGIVFHALAPSPGEVMELQEEALDDLAGELDSLEGFCEELDGFTAEFSALLDDDETTPFTVLMPESQDGAARRPAVIPAEPLLEELHEGSAVTAARCWNALHNSRALVVARRIELELETEADPSSSLAEAAAQTELAEALVARRESAYRYEPARTSDHEDTGGQGVDNLTDYPYRVYGRTHVLFFWHRRDRLSAEAVAGGAQRLAVEPQQLLAGEAVSVDATSAGFDEGEAVTVTWGEGVEETSPAGPEASFEHLFAEPSQPVLVIRAWAEGEPVELELPISVATAIYALPAEEFHLVEPEDMMADMALRPFLPTLQLGFNGGPDGAPLASLGFDRDGDGAVDHGTIIHLPAGERDGASFVFEGFSITVPVESASGRFGTIFLQDAGLTFDLATAEEDDDTIEDGLLSASIRVEELAALVVSTGVLERDGVMSILADIFDFDADDPPELIHVVLSLSGELVRRLEE